jgi:hypothetical protein
LFRRALAGNNWSLVQLVIRQLVSLVLSSWVNSCFTSYICTFVTSIALFNQYYFRVCIYLMLDLTSDPFEW